MTRHKFFHMVIPTAYAITGKKLQSIRTEGENYQVGVYRSAERPVGDLALYIDGLKELGEGLYDAELDYEIVHGELTVNVWGWRDATDEEDAFIRAEVLNS